MRTTRYAGPMACLLGLAAGLGAGLATAADLDMAPLVSRDTDVFGNARWRALGPLFERSTGASGEVYWAVRPLTSTVREPAADHCESDGVWPVWTRERLKRAADWRFLVLANGFNYDITQAGGRYKFMVFPLYFQGRDAGGRNYLAVFPLGGTIRDFLGRDAIWFALFPLTYNDRVNEVETRAWLWPVVSVTDGGGHDRFRVFPFYGYTRFRLDYDKRFLLWPVWTSARYRYPGASGSGFVLFPVMGHVRLTDQETWMGLPPLFRFSRGAQQRDVHCPWPLVQWSTGTVNRLYLWPFWGRKEIAGNTSAFVLWPLYRETQRRHGNTAHDRTLMVPVLHATHDRRRAAEGAPWVTEGRTLKVWPFFSYRREGDRSRLGVPSLFPFADYAPVDRNYAALWTLYARSACGPVREDEWFWGLVRWRRGGGVRHLSCFPLFTLDRSADAGGTAWSLLGGLVASEWAGGRRRVRLGYALTF